MSELTGSISVLDFGAVGDGRTDDTNAAMVHIHLDQNSNQQNAFIWDGIFAESLTDIHHRKRKVWQAQQF